MECYEVHKRACLYHTGVGLMCMGKSMTKDDLV